MSFAHITLATALEKVASGLTFRLQSALIASVGAVPYHPAQEVERSDEVDAACALVASEVARADPRESCNVAFRIDLGIAELVLWRIRDALRYLENNRPSRWARITDPKPSARNLLVDSWHSYAEVFWLERREKFDRARVTVKA